MNHQNYSFPIKKEIQFVARYTGYRYSRLLTVFLLVALVWHLAPSCIYMALLLLVLPSVMRIALYRDIDHTIQWHLANFLNQHHFTWSAYRAEKNASPICVLFFIGWQSTLLNGIDTSFLYLLPAILLAINILSRMLISYFFQWHIRHSFSNLKYLDT